MMQGDAIFEIKTFPIIYKLVVKFKSTVPNCLQLKDYFILSFCNLN
jgi:hypothetical protein